MVSRHEQAFVSPDIAFVRRGGGRIDFQRLWTVNGDGNPYCGITKMLRVVERQWVTDGAFSAESVTHTLLCGLNWHGVSKPLNHERIILLRF